MKVGGGEISEEIYPQGRNFLGNIYPEEKFPRKYSPKEDFWKGGNSCYNGTIPSWFITLHLRPRCFISIASLRPWV